jgi:hypothetical protein
MGKKFNLMRWAVHGQNFVNAYYAVMRNQGAAGVDGMPTEAPPRKAGNGSKRISKPSRGKPLQYH